MTRDPFCGFARGPFMSARTHATLGAAAVLVAAGVAQGVTTTFNSWSQWTDRAGNVHRSEGLFVHYYETDLLFNDDLGYVSTDALGKGTIVTDQDDAGSELEIHAYEYPWVNDVAQVFYPGSAYGQNEWSAIAPTSGSYGVTEGSTYSVDFPIRDNTTYGGATFGIVQAIRYMHAYYSGPLNDQLVNAGAEPVRLTKVEVLYDSGVRGTDYARSKQLIRISHENWASWDVIMHEYGHHVAARHGMDNSPGGSHGISDDLYNEARFANDPQRALKSTRLAWSEGLATYLSLSAVKHGGIDSAFTDEMLPATDRDDWYHDFDGTNTAFVTPGQEDDRLEGAYSIETAQVRFRRNGELKEGHFRGSGEANELAVQRILWDLSDPAGEAGQFAHGQHQDRLQFGPTATWRDVLLGGDNTGNTTFEEAWRDLTVLMSTNAGKAAAGLPGGATQAEAVARIGEILGQHSVAHIPMVRPMNELGQKISLRHKQQNEDHSAFWRPLVFSANWNSIVWDGGNRAFNAAEDGIARLDLGLNLPLGSYRFVVLNSPLLYTSADDFAGGLATVMYKYYWSGSALFHVSAVPAPGCVATVASAAVLFTSRRRQRFVERP